MIPDEAFIQAIREAPDDDAPRLIYADWLEEHGQPDRAEFIRVQCQLARTADTGPEWSALGRRTEDLLRSHWEEWVGPLREIVGPRRDRYGESWMEEDYSAACALTSFAASCRSCRWMPSVTWNVPPT